MWESPLTNTKANPGFVLYDQLNKATSLSHQSQINKTWVACHFCFYLSLQKARHFQRTKLNLYLPKMLQSQKLTTKISSQTELTMSRRLSAHNNVCASRFYKMVVLFVFYGQCYVIKLCLKFTELCICSIKCLLYFSKVNCLL